MIHQHLAAHPPRMRPLSLWLDPRPLVAELRPEWWNQYRFRTEHPMSPHREADDIWMRYNPIENLNPADTAAFNERHVAQWYPIAAKAPNVRAAAYEIMSYVGARTLGAVLITRVPPGKQIYPHVDGGWHARAHRKFLMLLQADLQQSFRFGGETMRAEAGEIFEFENEYAHSVLNPTEHERISMIVCVRDFDRTVGE